MQSVEWWALFACAILVGCTTEPLPDSPNAYRTSVARALNYYEGSEKRYLISTPLQIIPGRIGVCTREDIDDGRGGRTGGVMTAYIIESGRIVEVVSENNCALRNYTPLQPIRRT